MRVFKSEGNDRMEMCRTMLDSLLKHSVVQYSTAQCSVVQLRRQNTWEAVCSGCKNVTITISVTATTSLQNEVGKDD